MLAIMIATRNRLKDLRHTLQRLIRLASLAEETLVVDDGSNVDLRQILGPEFPKTTFLRFEESAGQSKRRSQAFDYLKSDFILQLDDDSVPVDSDSVVSALEFLKTHPGIGALAFHIFNGPTLPSNLSSPEARYHHSFVGCGVLFRTIALREVGGYQGFFQNQWEEEELALRLIKEGWAIYFYPSVLIHHQVSTANRNTARAWMRGFRNRLWAMAMHYPAHRFFVEGCWVLAVACMDSVRLLRPHYLFKGLWECLIGMPNALRLRNPMSRLAMARFDALRFRGVYTENEFRHPSQIGWADYRRWCRNWWKRPRQRSFWDWRKGDTGSCDTMHFAHEKIGDTRYGE